MVDTQWYRQLMMAGTGNTPCHDIVNTEPIISLYANLVRILIRLSYLLFSKIQMIHIKILLLNISLRYELIQDLDVEYYTIPTSILHML